MEDSRDDEVTVSARGRSGGVVLTIVSGSSRRQDLGLGSSRLGSSRLGGRSDLDGLVAAASNGRTPSGVLHHARSATAGDEVVRSLAEGDVTLGVALASGYRELLGRDEGGDGGGAVTVVVGVDGDEEPPPRRAKNRSVNGSARRSPSAFVSFAILPSIALLLPLVQLFYGQRKVELTAW